MFETYVKFKKPITERKSFATNEIRKKNLLLGDRGTCPSREHACLELKKNRLKFAFSCMTIIFVLKLTTGLYKKKSNEVNQSNAEIF